jgi:hypothetical protein
MAWFVTATFIEAESRCASIARRLGNRKLGRSIRELGRKRLEEHTGIIRSKVGEVENESVLYRRTLLADIAMQHRHNGGEGGVCCVFHWP